MYLINNTNFNYTLSNHIYTIETFEQNDLQLVLSLFFAGLLMFFIVGVIIFIIKIFFIDEFCK
jgi:hypothetical protein